MEKVLRVMKKAAFPTLYIAFALALDQVVKNWAVKTLPGRPIELIPDVFHLTFATNSGAAWSILSGSRAVLIVVSVAAFGLIGWLFRAGHMHTPLLRWTMYSVIGGALGNLWDRLFRPGGLVVDLFDFTLIDFPIFNVADIFITVGGTLFVIAYFLDFLKTEREAKAKKAAETETPDDPA